MPSSLPAVDPAAVRARLSDLSKRAAAAARALDFDEATELCETAYVLGSATNDEVSTAESIAALGYVAHLRCDVTLADSLYARASSATLDPERREFIDSRRAFLHYDRGDLGTATTDLHGLLARTQSRRVRADAFGYLGNIERAKGAFRRASRFYSVSRRMHAGAGFDSRVPVFTMDRAIAMLLDDDAGSAFQEFEALRRNPSVIDNAQLSVLVDHYAKLASACVGIRAVDPNETHVPAYALGQYLTRLRAILDLPTGKNHAAREALRELECIAPSNAHVRISLEIVERQLLRRGPARDSRALVVARSASYFRLGDEAPVPLAQRLVLKRLLHALADARVREPGVFVDPAKLVELAWPGERIVPAARKNRLHVAMSTLRKLGLRENLESHAGGYRIARDVRTIVID